MRPTINYDLLCGGSQVRLREMSVGQKQLCKAVDCAVRFLYIDNGEIQLTNKKDEVLHTTIPKPFIASREACEKAGNYMVDEGI